MNIACQLSARPNPRIGSNPIRRTDPSPIEMAKRFDYSALANVRIFNDAIGSDANLIGQGYASLKTPKPLEGILKLNINFLILHS